MAHFEKLTTYIEGSVALKGDSVLLECSEKTSMFVLISLRNMVRGKTGKTTVFLNYRGSLQQIGKTNPRLLYPLVKNLYSKQIDMYYIDETLEKTSMEDYMNKSIDLNLISAFDTNALNF